MLDEERIATISTFDDGTPQRQIVMGDLRMRYTNLDTGAVERDLNGIGFIEYGADGSYTFRLIGGAAVGFRPTDPYPAGMWVLDGYHEIYTAPQRAYRERTADHGSEYNICTDLA